MTSETGTVADPPFVVVGAGPAGLTGAYFLAGKGEPVLVFEKDHQVGGIARTVEYKGFRFDLGGHRFFTKVPVVEELWRAVMADDFLRRPRLSRIYYRGKFFDYPLRAMNALFGLGIGTSAAVVMSYAWSRLRPIRPEVSFEDWVSNRFGRRLFRIFFKTYTEKVWGMPCNAISAEWAAQRIKGLSLWGAITNALLRPFRRGKGEIKTLIEEFDYPRRGPGMMWEKFQQDIESRGAAVQLGVEVVRLLHHDGRVTAVEVQQGAGRATCPVAGLLSTMPLQQLVRALSPAPPDHVLDAVGRLKYRDFLTVALIIDQDHLFPDNWIYVHDPRVKLGRIQNFKNWSPEMVPDASKSCLGLEYFCFEGDGLWTMADTDLLDLGRNELGAIGLVDPAKVLDGTVVRVPKAYPVYDEGYLDALAVVKDYLAGFENLQVAGRNGMHKYNNQDHSMVTAILAVENLVGARHDVWAVNDDDEYHEEVEIGSADITAEVLAGLRETQPLVPGPAAAEGRDGRSPADASLR